MKDKIKNTIKKVFDRNQLILLRVRAGNSAFRIITSSIPFALAAAAALSHIPEAENRLSSAIEPNVSPQTWGYVRYVLSLAFEKASFPVFSLAMLVLLYTVSASVYSLIRGISDETESNAKDRINAVLISVLMLAEGMVLVSIEGIKNTQVLFVALAFFLLLLILYKAALKKKYGMIQMLIRSGIASAAVFLLTSGMNIYYTFFSHPEDLYGSLGGLLIIFSWIYSVSFVIIGAGRISL